MDNIRMIFSTAQKGFVIAIALFALSLSMISTADAQGVDDWTKPSQQKIRAQMMAQKAAQHFTNRDVTTQHQAKVVRVKAQTKQVPKR